MGVVIGSQGGRRSRSLGEQVEFAPCLGDSSSQASSYHKETNGKAMDWARKGASLYMPLCHSVSLYIYRSYYHLFLCTRMFYIYTLYTRLFCMFVAPGLLNFKHINHINLLYHSLSHFPSWVCIRLLQRHQRRVRHQQNKALQHSVVLLMVQKSAQPVEVW